MSSVVNSRLLNISKRLLQNQLISCNDLLSSRKFSLCKRTDMRFVQFQLKSGGPQHLGAQLSPDGDIFDISAVDSTIPNNLLKFLRTGNGIIDKAKRLVLFYLFSNNHQILSIRQFGAFSKSRTPAAGANNIRQTHLLTALTPFIGQTNK